MGILYTYLYSKGPQSWLGGQEPKIRGRGDSTKLETPSHAQANQKQRKEKNFKAHTTTKTTTTTTTAATTAATTTTTTLQYSVKAESHISRSIPQYVI